MSFIEQIQKFVEGKSIGNKNIRTSDTKISYITSTGFSKPYASLETYNKTAGLHGCPKDYVSISEKWEDLGYPIGSQMQTGQSCGKEGTFLQSSIPETTFDASYYLEAHPELVVANATDDKDKTGPYPNQLLSRIRIIKSWIREC
jgi:hypothetical protein